MFFRLKSEALDQIVESKAIESAGPRVLIAHIRRVHAASQGPENHQLILNQALSRKKFQPLARVC